MLRLDILNQHIGHLFKIIEDPCFYTLIFLKYAPL